MQVSSAGISLISSQIPLAAALDRTAPTSRDDLRLWAMKAALFGIVITSSAVYNELLVPTAVASILQAATVALWLVIMVLSYFIRVRIRLASWTDLALAVAFYGYAVSSIFWSDLLPASIMKSAALAMVTFSAYRLALSLSVDEILNSVVLALTLLAAMSVFCAVFIPSIGIVHSWMHNGQWAGLYASKQTLGMNGAYLLFFACYQMLRCRRWLPFLIKFVFAAACVIGSGSRGGGAAALAAIVLVYLSQRHPRLGMNLAFGPFVLSAVAYTMLTYLYLTDVDHYLLWGQKINLTERTFIWHYGLQHLDQNALLGFGLNNFWSNAQIYYDFKFDHGWVLDNFHSGYLVILIEIGLIGATIFILWSFAFGMRMRELIRKNLLPSPHFHFIILYMILTFMINITETIFLRSTSLDAALLATFYFASCQTVRSAALR
jgi:O-antigen ligase